MVVKTFSELHKLLNVGMKKGAGPLVVKTFSVLHKVQNVGMKKGQGLWLLKLSQYSCTNYRM